MRLRPRPDVDAAPAPRPGVMTAGRRLGQSVCALCGAVINTIRMCAFGTAPRSHYNVQCCAIATTSRQSALNQPSISPTNTHTHLLPSHP